MQYNISFMGVFFPPLTNPEGIIFRLEVVQTVASGCCDFLAQCIMVRYKPLDLSESFDLFTYIFLKIYRCWIVWDQNIRFVIIPSFLAIAYICQSNLSSSDIVRQYQFLSSLLATWLGSDYQLMNRYNTDAAIWISMEKWAEGSIGMNLLQPGTSGKLPLNPLRITSFALSMTVNALMTTLIVFKILKVFLEVKPTFVEQTLGSLATGGTKLRPVIFIIIESGMALFVIQLVRVVLSCLPLQTSTVLAFNLTIGINQMFNVIISLYSFLLHLLFF